MTLHRAISHTKPSQHLYTVVPIFSLTWQCRCPKSILPCPQQQSVTFSLHDREHVQWHAEVWVHSPKAVVSCPLLLGPGHVSGKGQGVGVALTHAADDDGNDDDDDDDDDRGWERQTDRNRDRQVSSRAGRQTATGKKTLTEFVRRLPLLRIAPGYYCNSKTYTAKPATVSGYGSKTNCDTAVVVTWWHVTLATCWAKVPDSRAHTLSISCSWLGPSLTHSLGMSSTRSSKQCCLNTS